MCSVAGGKANLLVFIDDLNMPQKDLFGSQPPLELLRQWMDYSCWFNLQKQTLKHIHGMQLIAAMGPPGKIFCGKEGTLVSKFQAIHS